MFIDMCIYIYVQYNIFSTWLIVAQAAAKQWIRRNAATSRSLARHSVRNAVQSYITYIYIHIMIMTLNFNTFQMALRWCSMLEFDGDLCCWCQVKTVPMTASHSGLA